MIEEKPQLHSVFRIVGLVILAAWLIFRRADRVE